MEPKMQRKILEYLKARPDFVSGQELSRQLGVSRATVWKYVRELRGHGYRISAGTHRGYRLDASPDRLFAWEIQAGLQARNFGRAVFCHEELASSMDEAFRLAEAGAGEGTLVTAECQRRGRGRLGRTWVSPRGKGLYLSLVLRPEMPPLHAARLTFVAAVAVCETVRESCGLEAGIKWPNDILIRGKKAAGILTEMNAETDRVHFVVVGLGLNVNTALSRLPPLSTSLRAEAGRKFSRTELVRDILWRMETWYGRLCGGDFDGVARRWKELSLTLGRTVRVADGGRVTEGKAVDLSPEGALVVLTGEGDLVRMMSGDVALLD
jgi:BirA family biotin operon repressor/biotin-[acetyl-CoA-carboxylase] ligase